MDNVKRIPLDIRLRAAGAETRGWFFGIRTRDLFSAVSEMTELACFQQVYKEEMAQYNQNSDPDGKVLAEFIADAMQQPRDVRDHILWETLIRPLAALPRPRPF